MFPEIVVLMRFSSNAPAIQLAVATMILIVPMGIATKTASAMSAVLMEIAIWARTVDVQRAT